MSSVHWTLAPLCMSDSSPLPSQAMVSARDRTLRIEEQLEAMGDELTRERANTVRERQRTLQVSAVSGPGGR